MKPMFHFRVGQDTESVVHIVVSAPAPEKEGATRLIAQTTKLAMRVPRFVESLEVKGEGAIKDRAGFRADLGSMREGDRREFELRIRVLSPDSPGSVHIHRVGLSYHDPANGCVMSSGANQNVLFGPARPGR